MVSNTYSDYIGYTFYHDSNGNYLNTDGTLPIQNYSYCSVSLDVSELYDKTSSLRTNISVHEMGHVLGLYHSEYDTALMVGNIYDKSRAVPSIGIRTPTGDDITGVQTVNIQ